MQHFKFFIVIGVSLLLAACNNKPNDVKIMFIEQEPGIEPYQTRLVVTENFMRFDDGEKSQDFMLYDRKKNIIYNVNADERTVMSVAVKKTTDVKPPFELKQEVKNLGALKDAPKIQDKSPSHYQFFVNNMPCYDVVAVKGLLPDVVKAMQELQEILSSDSKLTFSTLPADMHDGCNMSMSTFFAGQHLQYGFPVHEWTPNGTGRALIDFDAEYVADKKLFVLPENYKRYSIQDYREGKVKF